MARGLSNVDISTDTFLNWIVQTNKLLDAFSYEAITVSTLAPGGNGIVANTTGNAQLLGVFGSNTLVATDGLRGGNVLTSSELSIISNATVTASYLRVGANVQLNTTSVSVGNTSTNVIANSSTVSVGANVSLNTTALFIGNTSTNGVINSTTIAIAVGNYSNGVNVGSNVNLTTSYIQVGNSTTNISGNSTSITVANATQYGTINTSVIYHTSNVAVGSNVFITTTAYTAGNSTANAIVASNLVSLSNTANLTSVALTIGNTVANSISTASDSFLVNSIATIQAISNSNIGTSLVTPVTIFTFAKDTYSSAKITGQVKSTGNTQTSEMVLAHDGTNAYLTVYGTVASPLNADLGDYSVSINGANAELKFQQTVANSAVKILAHLIK